MKAGRSVEEAVNAYQPSSKYSRYEAADPGRLKQNAESIYATAKGTK